jgi:transposase-like protein
VTRTNPEELRSMGKRSEIPVNERREAVLNFLRREEPAAVIARRYGVAEATLYCWRDDSLAAGEAALGRAAPGAEAVLTMDEWLSWSVRSRVVIKPSAS